MTFYICYYYLVFVYHFLFSFIKNFKFIWIRKYFTFDIKMLIILNFYKQNNNLSFFLIVKVKKEIDSLCVWEVIKGKRERKIRVGEMWFSWSNQWTTVGPTVQAGGGPHSKVYHFTFVSLITQIPTFYFSFTIFYFIL